MGAARFEYVALFLVAAIYFRGRVELSEILIFVLAAAAICEIAMYRWHSKIQRWPSDLENGKRVLEVLGDKDVIDEIMSLEFGSATNALLDRLREIERPRLQAAMFNDHSMDVSFRYLQETVRNLLDVIRSEMFAPDIDFDGQMLPLEWKSARFDSDSHIRYREAQRALLAESRKVVEAVQCFANCFQGASRRL